MPTDLFQAQPSAAPVDLFAQQGIAVPQVSSNNAQEPSFQTSLDNFAQNPISAIGSAAYGLATGAGKAIGQDVFNAANLIPGVHLNPNVFTAPQGLASDIGGIAGHMAGFALPGGVATRAAESIPALAQTGNAIIPTAERLAAQGLSGATYGVATSPDGQRLQGGAWGLAGSMLPEAAVRGAIPTAGFVKNLITGTPNLSPEAQALQSQVGNLPVPYAAQTLYNKVLGNIPLSAVAKQQGQIADAAQQKANSIVDTLKGGQGEGDIAQNVANTIQVNHKAATENNAALYKSVADQADAAGVKISSAPNLSATATQYLNNSDNPLEPKEQNILNKYLGTPDLSAIGMGGGLKGGPLSFNEAHNLQKQFSSQAQSYYGKDNYLGKMYSDLSDSLKNDMEGAAQASGNTDVYNNLLAAKQDFAQNVAPYRDNSMYPIVTGDKNLNTIHNALLQNTPQANKVVSDLPDDVKKQVAYLNFSRPAISENPANGDYTPNPQKLYNAYNKMDETQKNKLFTSDDRQQFNTLGTLAQYSKANSGHLKGGIGTLEAALPLIEGMHGGLAGLVHGAALVASASIPARLASSALTNPELRNAYLSSPSASQMLTPQLNNFLSKLGVGSALQYGGLEGVPQS